MENYHRKKEAKNIIGTLKFVNDSEKKVVKLMEEF
jgi:hypothetical protein